MELARKMMDNQSLSEKEVFDGICYLMEGKETDIALTSFLTALNMKGITEDEIVGGAKALRKFALSIKSNPRAVDVVGTGGDGKMTFNISTGSALIIAAAGIPVIKHGNRAISSKAGSADVLEALGFDIELNKDDVEEGIDKYNYGFLYAPLYHKAMKYASNVRKSMKTKTLFNFLGPLTNPAEAPFQIIGIYDGSKIETIARVLKRLGSKRALVVHGSDGMDEITLTGTTNISELKLDGSIVNYTLDPKKYGFATVEESDLVGGDANDNAKILNDIFSGIIKEGPKRDILLLNSGAAAYVSGKVNSIDEGIELANSTISSGKVKEFINKYKLFSGEKNAK